MTRPGRDVSPLLKIFSVFVGLGGLFAFVAMVVGSVNLAQSNTNPVILPPPGNDPVGETRRVESYQFRTARAYANAAKPLPVQTPNGDESFYPERLGTFTKGLQHDSMGHVDNAQFEAFVNALNTRQYRQIPTAMRRYVN